MGWVVLVTVASVLYRRSNGKPLTRPKFDAPLFLETWRSGRSMRNFLSRLGGARNCLWVAVTRDRLQVGMHFPFSLLFLPEIYGLEITVPGESIRSVQQATGFLRQHRILVTVEHHGRNESMELHLSDADAFKRAVEQIRTER